MYLECSTKGEVTNVMKRIICFLIVTSTMSCSSAWAAMTVIESVGYVSGILSDVYGETANIDSSPLSGSVSYDSNGDGIDDSFAGSEVGLWYAEANVLITQPDIGGETGANGYSIFKIDSGQLTLNWNVDVAGYSPDNYPMCWVALTEYGTTAELLYIYYNLNVTNSAPPVGTQTLSLDPTNTYRLEWHLELDVSGCGIGPSDASARFTLDLGEDIQPIPTPSAIVLGSIGIGFASWMLKKQRMS